MLGRFPLSALGVVVAFALGARVDAGDGSPASLDVRMSIAELTQAINLADEAVAPLANFDRLRQWDALLASSKKAREALQSAVQHTDVAVRSMKEKAEKYRSDQAKTAVFASRIEALQSQSDGMVLLEAELAKSISDLQRRLELIRADPEVKQALQAREILERSDAALGQASNAVPPLLRE